MAEPGTGPSRAGRGIARDHIAVALDVSTIEEATRFAECVAPHAGVLKVGLELFVAHGPAVVAAVSKVGCDVFLDLKLHDIPETVGRSVARARDLGVKYLTVHASGGPGMLHAAAREAGSDLVLLGVTVLTSISEVELRALGVARSLDSHALALAQMCREVGVRGLVASALEVPTLRAAVPESFLVTPGIRPSGSDKGDQSRVATPSEAIRRGANLLVVGRPVRDAKDRAGAARAIEAEVQSVLDATSAGTDANK